MKIKNNHSIYYLNMIRIIACVLIIFVHTTATSSIYNSSPQSISWQIMCFFNSIGHIGVPLFVMISGALCLDPKRNFTIAKAIKKGGFYLFLYYAIIFLYNLSFYLENLTLFNGLSPTTFYNNVIKNTFAANGIYHLWYLPMIAFLYFMTPIVRSLVIKKEIMRFFLCLFIVSTIIFPTLFKFDFPLKETIAIFYNSIPLQPLTGYLGYYILGYYLHHYNNDLNRKKQFMLWISTFISISITVSLCCIDAYIKNIPSSLMSDPFSLSMFISSISIFLLIKMYFFSANKYCDLIFTFSKLTFGIYLIHPYFINPLLKFEQYYSSLSPLLLIPLLSIFIIAISGTVIFIGREVVKLIKRLLKKLYL